MPFTPPETFNLSEYCLGDRIQEGMEGRRALVWDGDTLTYGDLLRLASRYGNLLAAAGIRPEERVLIALPDTPAWPAALFGILRRGAVAVLVNPHLPPDQVRYLWRYTGARAAFVDDEVEEVFAHAAEGLPAPPTLLNPGSPAFRRELEAASPDLDPHPTHRDDAAIWLFSGGTTGHPKAVVQPHRSFANTTELYGKGVLGLGPDDVTLSVPKLFFGYATGINLLFPLSVGATAALFPERCTAPALVERIRTFRPTVLVNVPTMVNHLLALREEGGGGSGAGEGGAEGGGAGPGVGLGGALASLRLSTSAGEALPRGLHRRWSEAFGVPLLDGLGTAEMWHIFISNRIGATRPGSLGKVVPGFDVRVCDDRGRELPRDEVGWLHVRGGSRAIGYWREMEKTQWAFRGEWYVSGDMISMDPEGWVTYHGRGDDMLKVGGKWLSPAQLEDCLLAHPAVGEVVVVGVATPEGLVKPHAFVLPAPDVTPGPELAAALQEWTKSRLEPYKYPRGVTFLENFPRTHLGKVDRGKLAREAGAAG